ncbi:CDP-diacylglycerol--glycerol-3-phosphate 3-phosphatidyltransferase [Oceanotoga sp. DSM 15011]|uniref:CDP-diacylglycerol--glycerol-3-phosphate 3-phosphatidyltransferase n=1 Tax=Oceanotoga sp. DSM 15011 TaxID=2984951 RepID=UPI0021F4569E|nr:CDP-diacylglycerol--glycerol-3-phosphate 3-phosphatidyltransferase [Oceanotoga sp. DSM 15011]UYP01038.1 CDP-diacylglycerol--glycerol-3-phosphate 3-phosphatidyltransferase [Oceanotoga sp. DSM 15011]
MNIPNWLSFSRILAVFPLYILTVMGENYFFPALIVFIIASFTDLLDGWIARKYNMVTDLGKFFDQIADKIMINAVLISLLTIGFVPGWFVAIIVVRDTFVSGLRMFLANKNIVVAADKFGKLKTFLQIVLIIAIYLNFSILLNNVLIYTTAFVSLFSGFNYLIKNKEGFKM